MSKLRVIANQSLSVAVMLAVDNYNYNFDPKAISCTTLLKPLRALSLADIKGHDKRILTVQDVVASSTGSAVHVMLEQGWVDKVSRDKALARIGYSGPEIAVNPVTEAAADLLEASGHIIVWIEQGGQIEINGRTLTGTFDFCAGGTVEDLKNTGSYKIQKCIKELSVYCEMLDKLPERKLSVKEYFSNLENIRKICPTVFEFAMQGSIYKLINPKKIKNDTMHIQALIKDWRKGDVGRITGYPPTNPYQLDIPLFTNTETQGWVYNKLDLIAKMTLETLPMCDPADLWESDIEWKVYATDKSKRCLNGGTFSSKAKAQSFLATRPKGIIKKVGGEAKRCLYCSVRNSCKQADKMGLPLNKVEK